MAHRMVFSGLSAAPTGGLAGGDSEPTRVGASSRIVVAAPCLRCEHAAGAATDPLWKKLHMQIAHLRIRLTTRTMGGLALLVLAGCASVSPQRVNTDRMDYGQVVADSWKRQTLLNVVRLRYADAPVFLDVSSIINSY